MIPDYGTIALCQRHPSQNSSAFCSSCLIERLSAVDTTERTNKNAFFTEDARKNEYLAGDNNPRSKSSGTRSRRTLQYLFHLDDDFGNGQASCTDGGPTNSSTTRLPTCENGSKDKCQIQFDEEIQIDGDANTFGRRNGLTETGSSSCNVPKNSSVLKAHSRSKEMKDKGLLLWLDSVLPTRSKGTIISERNLKESSKLEKNYIEDELGLKHQEMDLNEVSSIVNKRPSCPDKVSLEDPRHSWDGVMVNKVSCPPFLDNHENGIVSISHRKRKNLSEEVMSAESASSSDSKSVRMETTANASAEVACSADIDLVDAVNGRHNEEAQEANISQKFRRRHWCGKAWYRSITSPWRDLFGRRSSLFHRSLSETWRDESNWRHTDSGKVDGVKLREASISSVAKPCDSSKNGSFISSDVQRTRPNSLSSDIRFGRSRSVHYSSPGNVENGLLRFYLTPLRSSRRASGRKTSGSFTRGILRL